MWGDPPVQLILTLVLQAMPKRKGVFPKIPPLRKAIKLNLQKKFGFLQSQFFLQIHKIYLSLELYKCDETRVTEKRWGGAGGAHELIRLV